MKRSLFLFFSVLAYGSIQAQTCTPTVVAAPASICSGQTTTLTASGGNTYTWSPGGSNASTIMVAPTSSTVYTLSATTGTCVASATVQISVTATPTLFPSASPGNICAGSTATLTANASSATAYTWSPGGANTSTVTVSPTSTTVYTITASNGGCVATKTVAVTVSSNPTVTVTGSVTICGGQSATLTPNGATTYTWTPGSGLNTTTGSVVIASPASPTVYTVTGSIGSCSAMATSTVNVYASPSVTATNNGPVCAGSTLVLSSSGTGSGLTYSWAGPNAYSAGGPNPSINNVSLSASGTYSVTVTDVNACTATATTTVTVNPNPVVTVTSATICTGATATLAAAGAATYSWSPAGSLSSSTGYSVIASPGSTTNYTVVGADVNLCTGSAIATVSVVPGPTLSITATPSNICSGQTTTLTASGASTYTWSANAGGVNTNAVAVSPNVNTTYTVSGSAGGCSDSTIITVNVIPTPTVSAISTGPVCAGQTATLTASGALSYTWMPGMIAGSSILVTPSSNTTYTVVGDNGGCVSAATVAVVAFPMPSATFTLVADTAPHVWDAYPTYTGGTPPYMFAWNWGDGGSSTVPYPSYTYSVAGTYSICVSLTDANGCTSTYCENDSVYRLASSQMVQINVLSGPMGIKNINGADVIKIYPNPANAELMLSCTEKIRSVTIHNSLGEIVLFAEVEKTGGNFSVLSLTSLREGIYFVSVRLANRIYTQKILVQR